MFCVIGISNFAVVLWNGVFSSCVCIKSSLCKDDINSHSSFLVYEDDLLLKLRLSGIGCYLYFDFVGCLLFADDILLLLQSILHIQFVLDICAHYGIDHDINFNYAK